MKKDWWKWLCVVLLTYTVIGGLLFPVPKLPILNETIRSLHFHVPMWFGMILLFLGSVIHAIKHLRTGEIKYDIYSFQLANMGIAFGVLGILTGMIWANFTWGEPWSNDPKQNASAISLLIYLAYFVLRGSIQDEQQRNRISAVFNIFAFFLMIPLLFILPRMSDSLHPGNGGNPGFNAYDLDSNLRKVFYLAVIGWTLLGYWITTIAIRLSLTKQKLEDA
ncbi:MULTISPECIES: cytochrome c biogenesis protein CcsA [unclassified Ekhidna]|uniref:cytochrome c biogenesis protein CcsA n=1 Tax=unclassified Ekhidna TaxID=2632188 RepID=UPI0032DEA5AB